MAFLECFSCILDCQIKILKQPNVKNKWNFPPIFYFDFLIFNCILMQVFLFNIYFLIKNYLTIFFHNHRLPSKWKLLRCKSRIKNANFKLCRLNIKKDILLFILLVLAIFRIMTSDISTNQKSFGLFSFDFTLDFPSIRWFVSRGCVIETFILAPRLSQNRSQKTSWLKFCQNLGKIADWPKITRPLLEYHVKLPHWEVIWPLVYLVKL